ncbi:MAG: sigma-70 family RNA polymerase sigma factor [Phycisphaerales bacterium]|nr:sigma-70 family RNA polymerase sigma factor [Phycisphaerae bacterium]NNM25666.1 sigma-70 family RNA polymerase sigma factor [Phycisphaerales bacterium]
MNDRDEQTRSRAETVGRLLRGDAPDAKVAAADLLPILYDELRTLARARMAREMPGQTIQATALVHEAYLRLVGDEDPGWNGRGHFFGAAALAMRRILVEQARRKGRVKHGGDRQRQPLEDGCIAIEPEERDLLAVDDAVRRLETRDPRKGQIVNLRYFAGLTAEQTAHALGVSLGTVEREWRFIKAWLQEELAHTDPEASGGSGRV